MAVELWDAYDRAGHCTGQTLVRGERIPEGLYHLVCDILVRHEDGSYLLMRRSPDKPNYPYYEEASAGGSALVGETPLCCACRELQEETGLSGTMTEVGRWTDDARHTHYVCYLCVTSAPRDAVCLQEGETVGYRWVDEAQFRAFLHSDRAIPMQARRWLHALNMT